MEIAIRELDRHNLQDVNRTGSTFTIDSRLVLDAEDGVIRYAVTPTPPYQKRYAPDKVDYASYVGRSDRAIFLAYVGGELAEQIRLRRNWNHFEKFLGALLHTHAPKCLT